MSFQCRCLISGVLLGDLGLFCRSLVRAVGLIREALLSYTCVGAGLVYGVAAISGILKNYRSLLQNIICCIWLFCKRDL